MYLAFTGDMIYIYIYVLFAYLLLTRVFCSLLEDLSKSEDKDDMKKEGEDGKGAKKSDDPEVNFISISSFFCQQHNTEEEFY